MTKEEIFDKYAIEQGYSDWNELILDEIYSCSDTSGIVHHENAVIQLIQDELKKKIYSNVSDSVLGNIFKCTMLEDKILNTENIK